MSQDKMIEPQVIEPPIELRNIIKDNIVCTYSIDFNSDSKNDYLVDTKKKKPINEDPYDSRYWVTSNFDIII
jgi:hypothetical protein